jgi:ABC-type uncharacterized transport system permease subunit
LPLTVMTFAYCWQYIPKEIRQKIPEGWDALLLIPVVLLRLLVCDYLKCAAGKSVFWRQFAHLV